MTDAVHTQGAFFNAVLRLDLHGIRSALDVTPALVEARIRNRNAGLKEGALLTAVAEDLQPGPHESLTALHLLARLPPSKDPGRMDAARMLLAYGADVNSLAWDENNGQCTPIVLAAWEGGEAMVAMLLAAGADVTGEQGAAALKYEGAFDLLVAHGAPVTAWQLIEHGGIEPVVKLVHHSPGLLSQRDAEGYTLLQAAVSYADRNRRNVRLDAARGRQVAGREMIWTLVRCGAPMDVFTTAALDDIGTLKRQLEIDPQAIRRRMPNGATALCVAASSGSYDALAVLLDKGADPNAVYKDTLTPLAVAASVDDTAACRLLLRFGATPTVHALCSAAWHNRDPECVRALLECGADANALEDYGAIHWACAVPRPESVAALLEYGADPDLRAPGAIDKVPLHFAAARHDEKGATRLTIDLLLASGADINLADGNGETPLDAARTAENDAVVAWLERHGGRSGA